MIPPTKRVKELSQYQLEPVNKEVMQKLKKEMQKEFAKELARDGPEGINIISIPLGTGYVRVRVSTLITLINSYEKGEEIKCIPESLLHGIKLFYQKISRIKNFVL